MMKKKKCQGGHCGWRWVAAGLAALAGCALVACGDGHGDKKSEASVIIPRGKSARERQERARASWSEMTEGAPARAVWVADPSLEQADTFADSDRLLLLGWDAREAGPRQLVADAGNFSRPLITPDGEQVVFTEKRMERRDGARHYRPRIRVVDWRSGRVRTLGKGFAVSVWAEPGSRRSWVYALEQIHPAKELSIAGSSLVRFPLDAPDHREPVWNRTRLSVDSIHLSRDGQQFSALFPWPDAGIATVPTGRWRKLDVGCWPALAPDDSQVAWVFDGPHRNLRMVAPEPERQWSISLSSVPDVRGKEAYHPRWSNHPRFIVFTGPYSKKKQGSRNAISSGGLTADVQVGKFSPDLQQLESSVRLTHNKTGDFYPDLWVGGGERATLAGFPQHPATAGSPSDAWPPSPDGLVFVWRDLRAANEVPDTDHRPACRLEARGIGRFSADLGAWLDGGWFEPDPDSQAAVAAAGRSGRGVTIQALMTEWPASSESPTLPLISWITDDGTPIFSLIRRHDAFDLAVGHGPSTTDAAIIPHASAHAATTAIALVYENQSIRLALNGQWSGPAIPLPDTVSAAWPDGRLILGQRPPPAPAAPRPAAPAAPDSRSHAAPAASIQRLTVHARALPLQEITYRAEVDRVATANRHPAPRVRARARVLHATTPDLSSLDTYHRLLVDHTYEVLEILEGTLNAQKIAVLHWAVLDDRPVPGFPRPISLEVELTLERHADRPELQGELTDLESDEFGLPLFLDVTPPPGIE